MEANNKRRPVLLKYETVEMLQTLKSSYTLARKKNITYDEIINMLIEKGLEAMDPKVNAIYKMATATECQDETMSEE